jgi:Holliday junction resolvasome RuvABC endonuclease subunit
VILYSASSLGLPVFEYTPAEIKIAVTGYGRSEKRQIIDMVKKLIVVEKEKKSDDERDWDSYVKDMREKLNDPNWDPITFYED